MAASALRYTAAHGTQDAAPPRLPRSTLFYRAGEAIGAGRFSCIERPTAAHDTQDAGPPLAPTLHAVLSLIWQVKHSELLQALQEAHRTKYP